MIRMKFIQVKIHIRENDASRFAYKEKRCYWAKDKRLYGPITQAEWGGHGRGATDTGGR